MTTNSTSDTSLQQSDPYRDWLGITSSERPPNHYQLLGLEEFEKDQSIISAAFERQFAIVRRYQVGLRSDEAGHLLQSLSAAFAELSHPSQKRAYDVALIKRQLQGVEDTLHDVDFDTIEEALTEDEIAEAQYVEEDPDAMPLDDEDLASSGVEPDSNAVGVSSAEATAEEDVWDPFATDDDGESPFAEDEERTGEGEAKHFAASKVALPKFSSFSGADGLRIASLASIGAIIAVPVGLLITTVAPIVLSVIAAYKLYLFGRACNVWFFTSGWRVCIRGTIKLLLRIDRGVGIALGDDNKILHNFVRVVVILLAVLAVAVLLTQAIGSLMELAGAGSSPDP